MSASGENKDGEKWHSSLNSKRMDDMPIAYRLSWIAPVEAFFFPQILEHFPFYYTGLHFICILPLKGISCTSFKR
jgi:hypothetical protein